MLVVVDEPLLRCPLKVHLEQEGEALSALAQVAEDFSVGLRNIPQRDCDSTRIMRVPRFVAWQIQCVLRRRSLTGGR